MRYRTLQLAFLAAAGALLMTGCINSHRAAARQPVVIQTRPIIVTEAPPAPRREVVGTPPGESHVWVEGHWMRADQRWVWVPGHWEARPKAEAVWVPGRWDKNPDGRGWVWTPGHWR